MLHGEEGKKETGFTSILMPPSWPLSSAPGVGFIFREVIGVKRILKIG